MKNAWQEIGAMIEDGFDGMTTTIDNDWSILVAHGYKIGKENWLTIKEECEDHSVNTINVQGEHALKRLHDFIGSLLVKH